MLYNLLQKSAEHLDDLGLYKLVRVLFELEFRAFFSVVFGFLLVVIGAPKVIAWLIRQKVGDSPEFYNAKLNEMMAGKAGVPTMGGVLISGSILITTLLFADLYNRYVWVALVVLVWLSVLGGIDDWLKLTSARRNPGAREGLFAWEKLLFQLGIGFIAAWFLYRYGMSQPTGHVLNLPFQRTYVPRTMTLEPDIIMLGLIPFLFIGILLIAGTSNAVNLTDGMDGLAAGTMSVASFAFMVLCYIAGTADAAARLYLPYVEGASEIMVITGAMAGACLGFLWYNCAPAKVFMGDTGSLPLGGLLAYIAIAIRQEVLLLIIGVIFFLEMFSVIMQVGWFKWTRWKLGEGRRIFRIAPIHHHFHLGGWSEQQVVVRFWVLAVIAAMLALVSIKLR